jgi:peptidoglycan/LPS O-acetylase OafA/YrhL
MSYRPEIDGLRALAVLPVIFFHAGFEWSAGGFVGVDVFFVISGYLITSIILVELSADKFSIINFYERRARRILPALFFVMLVCLPFSWLLLTPSDLKDFGQSLIAVSTFSSNFLFWMESGYFDTSAEFKPLLHTWSLAVEEQYYIFFPIFLALSWRLGINWIISLLALVFMISLVAAQWGSVFKPNPTFYLLPTRAWELLIGAFIAIYLSINTVSKSHIINQSLSLIGFIMIIFSFIFFNNSTPFPSVLTLVPTLGTGLIILYATPNTIINKAFSLSLLVKMGLISYSAYLWHQPILAFARHQFMGELSNLFLIMLCFSSLVLAYISWFWVEKPFRNRKQISSKMIFSFSLVGILFFISIGFLINKTDGLINLKVRYQFSEIERKNYSLISKSTNYDMYDRMYSSECKLWAKTSTGLNKNQLQDCMKVHGKPVIVFGDSHAMNVYNIISKSNHFPFVIGISQGDCRPHNPYPKCEFDSFIDFLINNKFLSSKIIFHQSGSYFIKDIDGNLEPSLDQDTYFESSNVLALVSYLNKINMSASNIMWLGPFTEYRINPIRDISVIKDVPEINFREFRNIERNINDLLVPGDTFEYIPFNSFFKITNKAVLGECLIWKDEDHFSECGEEHIAQNANFSFLFRNH